MGKEILTFGDIQIEKKKKKFHRHKSPVPLRDINLFLVKKTISTLLVNYIMIIKLSHHI